MPSKPPGKPPAKRRRSAGGGGAAATSGGLTHIDAGGNARMVDVSSKPVSERVAIAHGRITMRAPTLHLIATGGASKGDVLGVARLAGIMAAKRTGDLIPLCHPLGLDAVEIALVPDRRRNSIEITATCRVQGRTGVEMEALTAVSVAALTVYDMVKAVDREMTIGEIRLIHKSGGKSGSYDYKR